MKEFQLDGAKGFVAVVVLAVAAFFAITASHATREADAAHTQRPSAATSDRAQVAEEFLQLAERCFGQGGRLYLENNSHIVCELPQRRML